MITIEAGGRADIEYEVDGVAGLHCPGQSPGQRIPAANFSDAELENQEGGCSSSLFFRSAGLGKP